MYSFAGKPYIDLRLSFNSFLPKGLNNKTEKKIISNWLKLLHDKPYFHDKIEFEITDNCYYFNIKNKLKLKYSFLNNKEKNSFYLNLKNLTVNLIENYKEDFLKMNTELVDLEKYRVKVIKEYLRKKKMKKILLIYC